MIIDIPDEPIICALNKKECTRAVNNVIVNACKHIISVSEVRSELVIDYTE